MKCDPAGMHRGVDLISDALLFSRLWYGEPRARRAQHERLGGLKSGVFTYPIALLTASGSPYVPMLIAVA